MYGCSERRLRPRNGHTLIVGIVARISGCQNQKELSLEDQEDHGKEVVAEMCDGPVEFRVIATKGKGERLDRPELIEVEQMTRSRELDLLVMEDVGRLIRGAAAVRLWGIAVDHGTRCIAPNDCIDSADESWEEDLLSACRDHVGHNAHTSKRLKKKLMNRFKKFGGAAALLITGYIKPEDARTYEDWRKDDSATEIIREGLQILLTTLNCSAVADLFNQLKFPLGPYCRRKTWNGPMVRRFYKNRLLAGHPGRGFRHTIKHNESGRRVSVKNTDGEPHFQDYPHLAHVSSADLDEVNRLLVLKNSTLGRKPVNGTDPLWQRPKKRTRFPGQYARCWYCGHEYVWGANGVRDNLMCTNSREWHCWNSIGFSGELAATRIVKFITEELNKLDGFDEQFAELVREAHQNSSGGAVARWSRLQQDEKVLAREQENLMSAILQFGARPMFEEQLKAIDIKQRELQQERQFLESRQERPLQLPQSVTVLRGLLQEKFQNLAIDSPDLGTLLQQLVPDFRVYLVRLCDGGHLLPRARVKVDLAGHMADSDRVPELKQMLTRVFTLDLFDRPPQRERIREEVVRLAAADLSQRRIAARLTDENPKLPVVQQAIFLDAKMREMGISTPYVLMTEPPDDYTKFRRHKNPKYRFEARMGYERSLL